jgi:hypothetical protein
MNPFPDSIELHDGGMKGGSRIFILKERFRYISSMGTVTAHRGFATDGASIPRIFWNILSPFGDYFGAAIIHDWLYSPFNESFDRSESDAIFKEAMFNAGIGWSKRETIYRAVRLFGWRSFRGAEL